MEEKSDSDNRARMARFNALLEVAEEERIKYEKEKEKGGSERNLRANLSNFLQLLSGVNSSSYVAQNNSVMIKKRKRSVPKKKSNFPDDDKEKDSVALFNEEDTFIAGEKLKPFDNGNSVMITKRKRSVMKRKVSSPDDDEKEKDTETSMAGESLKLFYLNNSVMKKKINCDDDDDGKDAAKSLINHSNGVERFELSFDKRKDSNGAERSQFSFDQRKGKEISYGKKIICVGPSHNFEGNHRERDASVTFSYGNIIKKSSKRSRNTYEVQIPRPKKAKRMDDDNVQILPLPEVFKDKIKALGCLESEIIFVSQKTLTNTDTDAHEGRLLVPFTTVENHTFLTDTERNLLGKKNYGCLTDEEWNILGKNPHNEKMDKKVKIDAILIDPELDECEICVSRWDMRSNCNYALVTHWRKIVEKIHLKQGTIVQLYGFRKASKLGLILVVV